MSKVNPTYLYVALGLGVVVLGVYAARKVGQGAAAVANVGSRVYNDTRMDAANDFERIGRFFGLFPKNTATEPTPLPNRGGSGGARPDDPEALARRYPMPDGYFTQLENADLYPDETVRGTRRDYIDSDTAQVMNARFNTRSVNAVDGAPPPAFDDGWTLGMSP